MSGVHDLESVALAPESTYCAGIDPLSDVLDGVRLSGSLFFVVEAGAPWSAVAPVGAELRPILLPAAQQVVSYHAVIRGPVWFEMRDRPPLVLESGDVVVIPHGDPYSLASDPGRAWPSLPDLLAGFRELAGRGVPSVLREGGGGRDIEVFCGFLGCDVLPFNPVLAALPRVLHLRRPPATASSSAHLTPPRLQSDRLGSLIDIARAEAVGRGAGTECVLTRLGELLFVEVVRCHLSSLAAGDGGWLLALSDAVVGRALALLHAHPAAPWTLDELAHQVGVSRSLLAERFPRLVGRAPMSYLTRWRLQLAARQLVETTAKIATIAHRVGWQSEAAFSRTFRKELGMSPKDWRRALPIHQ